MSSLPILNDHSALFLDIDGTLLDIALRPEAVLVPERLIGTLFTLRDWLKGALALVSGRDLKSIERLFGDGFDMAGSHGHEWRAASVGTVTATVPLAAVGDAVEEISRRAHEFPGLIVEPKAYSIALHYRLAPEHQEEAQELARIALGRLGSAYCIQHGKSVVEVVPASAGKGKAIDRFMRLPPYRGRNPVFAGDDLTDESGFEVVNKLGGLSIRVGDITETTAKYALGSPTALRMWLDKAQH